MKQFYLKTLVFLLMCLVGVDVMASHKREINGIYYSLQEISPTAYVTYNVSKYNNYSGDVVIPETVTYDGQTYSVVGIDEEAFYDCSGLTSVTIPNSVYSIGSSAFYGCTGLTSITIPNSVIGIGKEAFSGCTNLTDVTINSNSVLSEDYYYSSSLKDIFGTQVKKYTIGNEVKSIGRYAFSKCEAIESIVFPNGMTTIGEYAFSGCSSLATVVIPNTVTSIGVQAFANCLSLYSVTSLINMPFNLDKTAFQYTGNQYDKNIVYMAATLYVPRGRTAMYKNIQGWQIFMNIMETDTKFKLTYVVDGEAYKTYEIQATEVITPEPDPYKEGFTFSGWSDIPYLMPTEDVTITGSFSVDPDYQTGMESVSTDRATSIAIYSLGGHRMNGLQRGMNIVRMSDGTVRKVVVR